MGNVLKPVIKQFSDFCDFYFLQKWYILYSKFLENWPKYHINDQIIEFCFDLARHFFLLKIIWNIYKKIIIKIGAKKIVLGCLTPRPRTFFYWIPCPIGYRISLVSVSESGSHESLLHNLLKELSTKSVISQTIKIWIFFSHMF